LESEYHLIFRIAILGFLFLQSPFNSLEQGKQAFRVKNWPAAEQFFTQAVQSAPRAAAPYKWLGMTYAAQEKYLLAEEPFRRACSLDPKEPQACYYLARTLFLNNRFPEALQAYERLPSKDGPALLGMALTLDALARFPEADVFFRKAIAAGDKQASLDYQRFLRRQAAPKPRPPDLRFEPMDLPASVLNGAAGAMHLPETMFAGVAVFDYDNDGWPDIFLANGTAPCALLHNNHNGTFTNVTAKAGLAAPRNVMGVAVADFDNDGFLDLFLTGLHAQYLFRNRGDGAFEDVTAKAGLAGPDLWTVSAAWLDYDNDGLLDLFVVRYVQWDPKTEPYCGAPAFRQYCDPRLYRPLPNALYRNLGNGRFRDVSESSGIAAHKGKGMGVALGDYDHDGLLDLFVANDTEPNFLFRNLGGGRFEECALGAGVAFNENGKAISSMGAEFRDLDNDGFEDLFITALANETFPLFHNTGKSAFADHTIASGISRQSLAFSGWSAAAIDLDNDGWKDLAVANGHINARLSNGASGLEQSRIYINRRTHFAAAALPGAALHRGLAYGDFDRDGRLDLVITRLNQPAQLWWNRNPSGNWIAFDTPAIGSLVKIETPQGAQWNRMVTTNGYAASSAVPLHFGLGTAAAVTRAEIRWPSGKVQTLANLPANQIHKLSPPR